MKDLQPRRLPYLSYHESQNNTIVLIHGAFSSCHEFSAVAPRLSQYHLLIPDHTAATMDPSFQMSDLVDAISTLINDHAKNSRAHLVGLSFGGHIALRVAGKHPDRTQTVFASGVNRVSPQSAGPDWFTALLPFLVWGSETFGRLIPGRIRDSAMGGRFCPVEGALPPTLQQIRNLLAAISAEEPFPALRARVFLLAATRTGWLLEDADSVQDAKAVFREVQPIGSEGSRCVTHSGLAHSWVKGHPELFAETVAAVVEGGPVKGEYVDIPVDKKDE